MGAHPDNTWCKQINTDDGPFYINWLQDPRLLPVAVPCARIMRYGYDSRWFGENAIKIKTSDISQQLFFDLKEFREVSVRSLVLSLDLKLAIIGGTPTAYFHRPQLWRSRRFEDLSGRFHRAKSVAGCVQLGNRSGLLWNAISWDS
jgi:hypothetical protein